MRFSRSRLCAAMFLGFLFCFILSLTMRANGAPPDKPGQTNTSLFDKSDLAAYDTREVLNAIRHIETCDGTNKRDGDNGRAIGDYQIQREFWIDSGITGKYELCRTDRLYSERVIIRYWQRYCPDALINGDSKTLIRVFHGGPNGATKNATLAYLAKVEVALTNNR